MLSCSVTNQASDDDYLRNVNAKMMCSSLLVVVVVAVEPLHAWSHFQSIQMKNSPMSLW